MRDVFISWSALDATNVKRVVSRLEQSRYTCHEYSADATTGSIADNVLRDIEDARMALIFLSPATTGAPWINTEIDWQSHQQTDASCVRSRQHFKLVSAAGLAPAVTRSQAEHVAATLRAVAPANGWHRGLGFVEMEIAFPGTHSPPEIWRTEGSCTLVAVR